MPIVVDFGTAIPDKQKAAVERRLFVQSIPRRSALGAGTARQRSHVPAARLLEVRAPRSTYGPRSPACRSATG